MHESGDLASWGCLRAARAHDAGLRLPVRVSTAGGPRRLGSVAVAHLPALADQHALIEMREDGLWLRTGQPGAIDGPLAALHLALRARGLIRAWRDEPYPWLDEDGYVHAVIERAAARFWGALTFGVHCNGYVADVAGRPTHLWIARRALHKPTDPGRLDNLVGGGVPFGQTPRQALRREAWEEAGLHGDDLSPLRAGSVLELCCDVPEGLQREWLYVYDLAMPAGLLPHNQDGEVAEHRCLPMAQALACAAGGEMTTDAALATLDFACRHALLAAADRVICEPALAALNVAPDAAARIDLLRADEAREPGGIQTL
jgi:8-oxo-dGTP pyrophosphatase MutT (NUDIX family)